MRWNNTLSKSRVFTAGVPQGSPLSPLLYTLSTSGLPGAIRAASPTVETTIYADDTSLRYSSPVLQEAGSAMQKALADSWATKNYVRVSPSKTVALICTVDPAEGHTKSSAPHLSLGGQRIRYDRPTILGVTFDPQMRFRDQARAAARKLSARVNIMRALAGTTWGSHPTTLRTLYNTYARPVGLYASGAWYPFLADTNRQLLSRPQNRAARIITGNPSGSPALETCRDANLLPLDLLAREEAAKLWVQCARRPANHPLHALAQPCGWPRRLRLGGGFRTSWRDVVQDALVGLPAGWRPDPWPPPEAQPVPWEIPPTLSSS